MKLLARQLVVIGYFVVHTAMPNAQAKRAIVPSDCVTVRTLLTGNESVRDAIQINSQGTQAAYLVKSPNILTNAIDIQLYVKNLSFNQLTSAPRLLISGELSELEWLGDGRHLTLLSKKEGIRSIVQIDSITGEVVPLMRPGDDIAEYSTNTAGDTIVFAVEQPPAMHSKEDAASGYRVPVESPQQSLWDQRQVFVSRRMKREWTIPQRVSVESPLDHRGLTALSYIGSLDLRVSPDGSQVLIFYVDMASTMPESLEMSPAVKFRRDMGMSGQSILVDYHLNDGTTTMPFATTYISSAPLWSPDGKSFLVMAHPPAGSALEQRDERAHRLEHSHLTDLFWVDPQNERVVEAVDDSFPFNAFVSPLCWNGANEILLLTAKNALTWFRFDGERWKEKSTIRLPISTVTRQVVSNGEFTIGDFSDTVTPPQLFIYRSGDSAAHTFAQLNPQFDQLTLARPTETRWKTSTGFDVNGLLLLPPDYVKGKRYPLVIQTKPFGNYFACSNGAFPAFAPQPIADAGIMYLGIIGGNTSQREEDYYPSGFPGPRGAGGVAEAAFQMDVYDSAVKSLAEQGMIDPERVGIIGFSRTGWYTDFSLEFSKTHYRAATTADNVQYSLSEYWLDRGAGADRGVETMYGGPPYGDTLKNWINYSISFNLEKIRTPLLIEQMGYGTPYDDPLSVPLGLVKSFEIISGLYRHGKPFELYYYPNEGHEPRHPRAQLATWQRNVDWYRFWLQGYERPHPEDPDQYARWRKLRELQNNEDEASPRSVSH